MKNNSQNGNSVRIENQDNDLMADVSDNETDMNASMVNENSTLAQKALKQRHILNH
jgi:hypothetical protein